MCNLYSLTKGQAAIRDWFRARHDRTGNLPLFPGIFPDQMAPIVRNGADSERELFMARWGMPGPPQFGGAPITNIRNVGSPHWRGWLGKQNRCIVPATSFCEYADTKPRKTPKWFALSNDRPLFAFAGLWTPWRGVGGLKSAPVDGQHELFGFLTSRTLLDNDFEARSIRRYAQRQEPAGPRKSSASVLARPGSFSELQRSGGHKPEEGFARPIAVAKSAPLASNVIPSTV
jgi:SOS response associated peptidase (SRAP)